MTGRKSKPTALKALQGTLRADRTNAAEPAASNLPPEVPAFVTGRAIYWHSVLANRATEIGVASRTSSEALGMAAVRAAEVETLTEVIDAEGSYYETETASGGRMVRAHPAVSQRADAMRHLQSLLAEFGLTPSSIAKVGRVADGDEDDEWTKLRAM